MTMDKDALKPQNDGGVSPDDQQQSLHALQVAGEHELSETMANLKVTRSGGLTEHQQPQYEESNGDNNNNNNSDQQRVILCDLGYGIPKEARPRREKILSISRQMVNFLLWQRSRSTNSCSGSQLRTAARLEIVGCNDEGTIASIRDRMHQLWADETNIDTPFPNTLSFSSTPLGDEESCYSSKQQQIYYLSPDADVVLDESLHRRMVPVVGLLIDRRVQLNRSKKRASKLSILPVRLPLDGYNIDPHEPLNCDCVLETMQRWFWMMSTSDDDDDDRVGCNATTDNVDVVTSNSGPPKSPSAERHEDCCLLQKAIHQAMESHVKRHPKRPIHKPVG